MSNQSVTFLEEITKCVDDGSTVDVVYLDFQKAINKMPYQILFLKLTEHCICSDVINWIQNRLTDRTQRVVIYGETEICFEWGTTGSQSARQVSMNDVFPNGQASTNLINCER